MTQQGNIPNPPQSSYTSKHLYFVNTTTSLL